MRMKTVSKSCSLLSNSFSITSTKTGALKFPSPKNHPLRLLPAGA